MAMIHSKRAPLDLRREFWHCILVSLIKAPSKSWRLVNSRDNILGLLQFAPKCNQLSPADRKCSIHTTKISKSHSTDRPDFSIHAFANNNSHANLATIHRIQRQQTRMLEIFVIYIPPSNREKIGREEIFCSPIAWSGRFVVKSSDEDTSPCWIINGFLFSDACRFELQRKMVNI